MHTIIHHGEETDFPLMLRIPPPRYELAYTAKDGDDSSFRPQIELHCVAEYDLDGTAIHVRNVRVESVVMYSRPDFKQGREVPFEDDELKGHASWVKTLVEGDEDWQREAYDHAETIERTGDDF